MNDAIEPPVAAPPAADPPAIEPPAAEPPVARLPNNFGALRDTLFAAVRGNNASVVDFIVRRYPEMQFRETKTKQSFWFAAVDADAIDAARVLPDEGINAHGTNQWKRSATPLISAILSENVPMVELLLDRGVNVNYVFEGETTPLMRAIRMENMPVIRLLIERGADVNLAKETGPTPLMETIDNNFMEAFAFLLESNADVNIKDTDGKTALHYALKYGRDTVIADLLNKGARIDGKDRKSRTPLYYAVEYFCVEGLKVLLARGASVNIVDKDGVSPILLALTTSDRQTTPQNKHEIVRTLLQHGATSNIDAMLATVRNAGKKQRIFTSIDVAALEIITAYKRERQPRLKRARVDTDDSVNNNDNNDDKTCTVCLTNPIEVTLAPCGHRGLCKHCVQVFVRKPCPFCRKRVESFIAKEYNI